jgi:GNAT superfamily N-acetyltransferase
MLSIPAAIDLVTQALALNRSIVAPAHVTRHGPLWILRDTNPKPGKARNEEVFAYGASPQEIVDALHDYAPSGGYALEPFLAPGDDAEQVKATYKALGFRLITTEPLFGCDIAGRSANPSPWAIHRVQSLDQVRDIGQQIYGRARRRLRPADLTDSMPAMQIYWVNLDGQAVAAAKTIRLFPDGACLHDVETLPAFRRRGIATALLNHILAEDAHAGVAHHILLASHTGAKLYPRVGYEQLSTLQIYAPVSRTQN